MAAIGEAVAGAVSGGVGAGINAYNVYQQVQQWRQKRDAGKKAVKEADTTYGDMLALLDEWKKGQTSLTTDEDKARLASMIKEYGKDLDYDFGEFEFGKSIEDYRDPYYQDIINATAQAVQGTAAGSGIGRGTGAATSIAEAVAKKDDELNKTAYQMYSGDRSQAYQEYSDFIQNMQNRYKNLADLSSTKINLLSGAIGQDTSAESDYMADLLDIMKERASSNVEGTIAAYA